jgi:hypothetical protein
MTRWPPNAGAHQDRSSSHAVPKAIRLPPDVLETWWERALAAVAVSMVVWAVADIVLNGL